MTYLGPVVAMAICYTLMGRELWGSKSIGEQTQRQLDNIKSKRKVRFTKRFKLFSNIILKNKWNITFRTHLTYILILQLNFISFSSKF